MVPEARDNPVVRISISPSVDLPEYQTDGAAGCDLALQYDEIVDENPRVLRTGLRMAIPPGWCGLIVSRSSLAAKQRITVVNSPGVVDSDYRGEIGVALVSDTGPHFLKAGTRVAQLLFVPVGRAIFVDGDDLGSTRRGNGGWGSTGR